MHNLGFLRTQAERSDPRLIEVWPRESKADRTRFEKLKEAYVKARYSRHYRITEDELAWLGEPVEALQRTVRPSFGSSPSQYRRLLFCALHLGPKSRPGNH